MCLTKGVTILASKEKIQLVLSSQFTVCGPVWSAKAYMYLCIGLFLLTALYMHLLYPTV